MVVVGRVAVVGDHVDLAAFAIHDIIVVVGFASRGGSLPVAAVVVVVAVTSQFVVVKSHHCFTYVLPTKCFFLLCTRMWAQNTT